MEILIGCRRTQSRIQPRDTTATRPNRDATRDTQRRLKMNRMIMLVVAACTAAMLGLDADAKRLGGGRSYGPPRDAATQRQMTPPANNVAPATPAATPTPAPAAA